VLSDLYSVDASNEEKGTILRKLVGNLDLNADNVFPKEPDHEDIKNCWQTMRDEVRRALGWSCPFCTPTIAGGWRLPCSVSGESG
jgi:hypothetical protein